MPAARTLRRLALASATLVVTLVARAQPASAKDDDATARATSADPAVAAAAVAELRAKGPEGLAQLLAAREYELTGLEISGDAGRRLIAAIDATAAQRDARFSRLYWHTDLESAVARARAEKKPILSLRLLGRLDQERSCANSRFFRTALYADPAVSKALSEGFVLHWKSVRPVPIVTIDFGDGRVIERPFTGNSVHYVLDAEGQVVDAIPGLVGPSAFLRALESARDETKAVEALPDAERRTRIAAWHRDAVQAQGKAWAADLAAAGLGSPTGEPGTGLSDEAWDRLGALHAADARLSRESVGVMKTKTNAAAVIRLAVSKMMVEDPLVRTVRRFERSIAEDTVRNEYVHRRAIRRLIAAGAADAGVEALNERVYAEVFLTPSSDPWLGLVPADEYAALDGAGLKLR